MCSSQYSLDFHLDTEFGFRVNDAHIGTYKLVPHLCNQLSVLEVISFQSSYSMSDAWSSGTLHTHRKRLTRNSAIRDLDNISFFPAHVTFLIVHFFVRSHYIYHRFSTPKLFALNFKHQRPPKKMYFWSNRLSTRLYSDHCQSSNG